MSRGATALMTAVGVAAIAIEMPIPPTTRGRTSCPYPTPVFATSAIQARPTPCRSIPVTITGRGPSRWQVEARRGAIAFCQAYDGKHGCGQPDGHVHPEYPVPVQPLADGAADERPGSHAEAGDAAPEPDDGAAALRREGGGQDGQTEGHDDRGADTLQHPKRDQQLRAWRQGARGRRDAEHCQTGGEQAPPPESIAESGRGDDARGVGQCVRIDRPLQGR